MPDMRDATAPTARPQPGGPARHTGGHRVNTAFGTPATPPQRPRATQRPSRPDERRRRPVPRRRRAAALSSDERTRHCSRREADEGFERWCCRRPRNHRTRPACCRAHTASKQGAQRQALKVPCSQQAGGYVSGQPRRLRASPVLVTTQTSGRSRSGSASAQPHERPRARRPHGIDS